jgi:hypothetical protein
VGLNALKSLNLINVYPNKKKKNNNNKKNNNKVKSKPLELFELAGKKHSNLYTRAIYHPTPTRTGKISIKKYNRN